MSNREPKKTGRPLSLNQEKKDLLLRMARCGLTDAEMANIIGITEQTLNNHKRYDPIFFESLKNAKVLADAEVIDSLRKRAIGYECVEEKQFFDPKNKEVITHNAIKHYPPDPTSMIFWLKNRQPDKFREKVENETTLNTEIKLSYKTDEE